MVTWILFLIFYYSILCIFFLLRISIFLSFFSKFFHLVSKICCISTVNYYYSNFLWRQKIYARMHFLVGIMLNTFFQFLLFATKKYKLKISTELYNKLQIKLICKSDWKLISKKIFNLICKLFSDSICNHLKNSFSVHWYIFAACCLVSKQHAAKK